MRVPSRARSFSVALVGNPNTGKSTVFTALAGIRQRVGNYPGVTVEKKTGLMDYRGRRYELVDLPGLYSVAPVPATKWWPSTSSWDGTSPRLRPTRSSASWMQPIWSEIFTW
jgi:hypothetical protein